MGVSFRAVIGGTYGGSGGKIFDQILALFLVPDCMDPIVSIFSGFCKTMIMPYVPVSFMATPMMTADPNLQNYLRERKLFWRNQGYSRRDAESMAFQEMLQAKQQGYIEDQTEPGYNPYEQVVFKPD